MDRLFQAVWPFRWSLVLCLLLMLLESVAALAVPWMGGKIAAGLISDSPVGVSTLAPALIALFGVMATLRIAHGRLLSETSQRLIAALRSDLYDHVQRLPLGFFHDRRRGDTLALLTREIEYLSDFVTGTLLGLLPRILVLIGGLVLMILIDPILALPVLVGLPSFFLVLKLLGRRLRLLAGEMRDAYGSTVSIAEQNLGILPAIKSFAREDIEARRYGDEVIRHRDLALRMARIRVVLGPSLQFVSAAAVIVMLWLASRQVQGGDMTPGELVAFLLYAGLLTRPIAALADSWGELQHARGALAHMRTVLATPVEDARAGLNPARIRGALRLEGVSFAYSGRKPVLCNADLDIHAGETIALIGPNGAGKTTLIDLLVRFHTPNRGRILLDGHDIATLQLGALRRAVGVVPQTTMLIDGTLEENVRFGNPSADEHAIAKALSDAQATGFVQDLPNGLRTQIGERGVRLSGGQRQRIALARALLKDPAIMVFDEPTAMFDPDGEARFVESVRPALSRRTVILITHRPASLALADRVVHLVDGRIVEDRAMHPALAAQV